MFYVRLSMSTLRRCTYEIARTYKSSTSRPKICFLSANLYETSKEKFFNTILRFCEEVIWLNQLLYLLQNTLRGVHLNFKLNNHVLNFHLQLCKLKMLFSFILTLWTILITLKSINSFKNTRASIKRTGTYVVWIGYSDYDD